MENRKTLHFFTRPEKLFLGVCAVLSQKLKLSPAVIRIAFIVLTLFLIPPGIILYIILYTTTHPIKNKKAMFGLFGAALGVPLSYYFQSDMIKHYSGSGLFGYLKNFIKIVDQYDRFVGNSWDIVFTLFLSVIIFAILGVVAGYFLDKKINKMNTFLVLISLLALLWAGCSKDDDNPNKASEYYFQFKADGTDQNYKFGDNQVNLTGSYKYDGNTGIYALNISGSKNIFESGKNTLTIFVGNTGEISKEVNYSNIPGEGDEYPDFSFSMGYYNSEGNLFIAGGAGNNPMFGLYKPAFVKFSEITESVISGTFSGTLLWYDSSGGTNVLMDSVVISAGKFSIPAY